MSITETDHEVIDDVIEILDEAQAYAQDNTSECIDRALTLLGPLLGQRGRSRPSSRRPS
ncbi:hypothetical protein ACQPXS_46430 [Streptomyces sp. CA-142005]|uniref:hypothetical protein n=1 Tax=Streptomyces sp. CA-142005 TaxID=3240052 RepID=UPI003D9220AB